MPQRVVIVKACSLLVRPYVHNRMIFVAVINAGVAACVTNDML